MPVYWPILLVYFFVLFALTMRRQIQYVIHTSQRIIRNTNKARRHRHMIKYKYVPFDLGRKARYGGHR